MNGLDIILIIPLLYAAYKGYKEGIVLQLGGIVALIIGVYLAFRSGGPLARWMGMDSPIGEIIGFLIVVVGVILLVALLGRLCRGLFKFSGLGLFDQVGGVILSLLKMGLILSVLMSAFVYINKDKEWVKQSTIDGSKVYRPIRELSDIMFPYLVELKDHMYHQIDRTLNSPDHE